MPDLNDSESNGSNHLGNRDKQTEDNQKKKFKNMKMD